MNDLKYCQNCEQNYNGTDYSGFCSDRCESEWVVARGLQ